TGMSAMLMRCSLRYDLLLLIASVLIAIGAATTALWLAFRTRGVWRRLGRCGPDGGRHFRDALYGDGSGNLFADDAGCRRNRSCGFGAYSISARNRGADIHHSLYGATCLRANVGPATGRAD